MRTVFAVVIGILAAAGTPAAHADDAPPEMAPPPGNERVDHFSAALFAELLDTLGLSYSVGQGQYGQPTISVTGTVETGAAAGQAADGFEVQFFGCDAEGLCDEVSLVSRYIPARPTSLTTLNRFNQGTRFTTAYTAIDGDLVLSMDLSAVGGIGRQATMIMIAIYVYNMESFAMAIGYS